MFHLSATQRVLPRFNQVAINGFTLEVKRGQLMKSPRVTAGRTCEQPINTLRRLETIELL